MKKCCVVTLTAVFVLAVTTVAFGQAQAAPAQAGAAANQGGQRGQQAAAPAPPTPRWPDGKPRMGALPDAKGLWGSCCGTLSNDSTPFKPWAKAVLDNRRIYELEPHTRCKPSGGSRQFITPYSTEMVEDREHQRIYIFDIGGPHTVRTIYMDGRQHPADLQPTYYGYSVGHWEGDTLVVDTRGFNETFWMDRAGTPHTEQLRFVERFTRTDFNTMEYQVEITDPGAYTAPWKTNVFRMRFNANNELFEYVCQDNNFGAELMVGRGDETAVDRSSPFIP
jgi:hypothetical protein